MIIRTIPTTLLQKICKIIFDFQVMVKGITGPDDNFGRNFSALMGQLTLNRTCHIRRVKAQITMVDISTNHCG